MDADDHPVEIVLKESRRFLVPLYQRKYQWGDKRLEPFWEDVSAKASEILYGDSKFQHYMGALILAPIENGSQIAKTPKVQVVDGQQRLTTFQLFLASLREIARENDLTDLVSHTEGYLFNVPKAKDTDPLTRFKLTPTPTDREIFHDIIDLPYPEVVSKYYRLFWAGRVPKNTEFPAFRAYYLFCAWIRQFAEVGLEQDGQLDLDGEVGPPEIQEPATPELISDRLEALLNAVLDRLKLVVITLGEEDDAQVIFETLNSKGEPLLAMDLVRNNIFQRAEKQSASVEELYNRLWQPLDGSWWRESAPNARPKRPRLDHFLAHTLMAETGSKISIRELYAEYRSFAIPRGIPRFQNVEDELKLIERYAPLYQNLEGDINTDSTLNSLGRKLAAWQVTTAYPIAMQVGMANLDTTEKKKIAQLIYSFIARRALCGLTTKNLNNVFQSIASEFLESGVSVSTLQQYFSSRHGDSTRFPSDRDLIDGILSGNAYSISPRTRLVDILWELECASRSNFAEQTEQPSLLSIEHVLPQTWTDEWPLPNGSTIDPETDHEETVQRKSLLHTLGNLTLTTGSLNASSGNSSFIDKREKYRQHTGLFLNKWFVDKAEWTEVDIVERGQYLGQLAKNIWPSIERI